MLIKLSLPGAIRRADRPRQLVLVALFLVISFSLSLLGPTPEPTQSLRPMPGAPAERTIEAGLFVKNIYNLSLANRTFAADGWFWLLWPQSIQTILDTDHIPITDLVDLPNDAQGFRQHLELDTPQPQRQSDGRYLQAYRFSGTFYDETLALRHFPFLNLGLPITIETRPDQFMLANRAIVLQNRQPGSEVVEHSLLIHGYQFRGVSVASRVHLYGTDFGEVGRRKGGQYSQLTFNLLFRTNTWAAINTFLLPWLLVMVILLLAPSLEAELFAQRLAIPPTALLTLVFLQQGAHEGLPMLGYLTYLDKLYLFGYVAATVEFGLFVWGANTIKRSPAEQLQAADRRINGIDSAYQLAIIIGALGILILGLTGS